MNSTLKKLADNGDISPLSYYFAGFITEHSAVDADSLLAYSAALVSQTNQNGDVCVELDAYLDKPLFSSDKIAESDMPLGIEPDKWKQSLLASNCVGTAGEESPLIFEDDRLYLYRYWHYESRVSALITSRLQPIPDVDTKKLSQQLAPLFPDHDKQLSSNSQALCVALAAMRRFVVISGGPGTGKTTTVIKILALLLAQQPAMRIKLAAPTGKAAARMIESIAARKNDAIIDPAIRDSIPQQASTIHRLLGYNNHRFRHSANNPLAIDCLVIDEASMLDLNLIYRLLDALPTLARIILLGDRDQLASVAAGNVLGDITGHGRDIGYSQPLRQSLASVLDCPIAEIPQHGGAGPISDSIALLTQSYRFSRGSDIGRLAELVNQGKGEAAVVLLKQSTAGLGLHVQSESTIRPSTLDWVFESFDAVIKSKTISLALDEFNRTRILCAIHSGPFGVDEVNRLITNRIQPNRNFEDYHGKPILITRNDYELNLFNGDTGLLWRGEDGDLRACFHGEDGGIRELPIYSLPDHVTAWAMTVHKSQGSEFETVLLILPDDAESNAVSRELLYTAITRTRRNLLIHSTEKVLTEACEKLTKRSSGLAKKLGWGDLPGAFHNRCK
jgi:exodeoxyribonuclease V alpha subunit